LIIVAENFFGGELPFGPVIIQLISAVDVTIFCSVICEGVQHE